MLPEPPTDAEKYPAEEDLPVDEQYGDGDAVQSCNYDANFDDKCQPCQGDSMMYQDCRVRITVLRAF